MNAPARACFLAVLGLASLSFAQAPLCGRMAGPAIDMQIRLTFEDSGTESDSGNAGSIDIQNDSAHRGGNASQGGGVDYTAMQIRVQLQDAQGVPLQETTPRSDGKVTLRVCSRAAYRVRVTGADIEESVADDVQPGRGDRVMTIVLHKKGKEKSNVGKGTIAVSRLRVPKKAQKELEQGNRELVKGNLQKARYDFERAIEIYPSYDQAYNNLGVVLMQSGDREAGREAFEKAVALNDHFARAYINLAKIAFDDKQYSKACDLARKSLSSEPLNPGALFVAAEASFFTRSFRDTVTYTRTLHTLPHEKFALAHFLSGKSLEAQNLPAAALAEYELFVKEDPNDSNVPKALEAMRALRSPGLAQQ